jgi:serine/threonine protein kinase
MLLDFNLSTDLADVQNRIGGTLPYMSPEQVEQVLISPGEPSTLDERTDLYSVGVIGYELLRGRLPFATDGLGIADKQHAQDYVDKIQAGAPSLRANQLQLDHRTAQVIAQCLEADRDKRPSSAKVLLAQLESCRTPLARLRRAMLRHPRRSFAIAAGIAAVILAVTVFLALRAPLHVRETELAWQALAANDQSGAREHFQQALAAEPQYIDALNGMGRVDFLAGIYNSEDNPWKKSYELQPDPRIAACLGYQDCVHGKLDSGLVWLEKAQIELDNSAELLCNLATIKRLRGSDWQAEAIDLYSRALEIKQQLRPALVGRAQAAFTLDKNSKQPIRRQAVEDLDQAVLLQNPSPELLATTAKYHLAAYPSSEEHYQKAKLLAIRSLEEGLGYAELKNILFRERLMEEPEMQSYQEKKSALSKENKESIWADPWKALFSRQ